MKNLPKVSEASKFMYELALEEDWNIDENGEYRKFSLEEEPEINDDNDDDDDDDDIDDIDISNEPAGVKIMHKDHKGNSYPVYIQEKSITRATTGDWCVQDEAGSIEKFYDAIYTRDEVRSAFAKSTDTRFVDTRSYKMK